MTCASLLVDHYKLCPTVKDVYGWSPLHWACVYGSATVVSYLLSLPTVLPTINDKEDVVGRSALDLACILKHLPVIKLLLRQPSIIMPTNKLQSRNFDVLSLLSDRMEWSTEFDIEPYSRVFMAGNSGAGKTTLTTAILSLDSPLQRQPRWPSVWGEDPDSRDLPNTMLRVRTCSSCLSLVLCSCSSVFFAVRMASFSHILCPLPCPCLALLPWQQRNTATCPLAKCQAVCCVCV